LGALQIIVMAALLIVDAIAIVTWAHLARDPSPRTNLSPSDRMRHKEVRRRTAGALHRNLI
jgi:hypothetical protein